MRDLTHFGIVKLSILFLLTAAAELGCSKVDPEKITNANQFVAACLGECDRRCSETDEEIAYIGFGCTHEGEYCPSLCRGAEYGLPMVVNENAVGCWCGPTEGMWRFSRSTSANGANITVLLDSEN